MIDAVLLELVAAGPNLTRLLSKQDWGRRHDRVEREGSSSQRQHRSPSHLVNEALLRSEYFLNAIAAINRTILLRDR